MDLSLIKPQNLRWWKYYMIFLIHCSFLEKCILGEFKREELMAQTMCFSIWISFRSICNLPFPCYCLRHDWFWPRPWKLCSRPTVCLPSQAFNPMCSSCYAHGSLIKCLFLSGICFIMVSWHPPCFTLTPQNIMIFNLSSFSLLFGGREGVSIFLHPIWK